MSRVRLAWLSFLMVAVVCSGVAVVYAKFLSCSLFVELQQGACRA